MRRVTIIGGGPAGSAAAIHLARAGVGVTIIEARAFPHVKVCGEFISPAITGALESLISADELRAAGARRINEIVIEMGEKARSWTMPTPAWALSRSVLDGMLLNRARTAGTCVLSPMRVESVEYRDCDVRVTLADGSQIDSDLVLHADGSGRLDRAGPIPLARGLLGHKCHVRPPEPIVGVRMRIGQGGYVGTIGLEHGLATVALATRSDLIARSGGDADAMLSTLWPRYDPAWRVSDWLACGIVRSGYRSPGHPRSLRIGNAAAGVDPIGGEGIGLAIWAGLTVGGLLTRYRPGTIDELRGLEHRFARAYRARLRWRRPTCRLGAAVLMQPWLARLGWPVLGLPALTIAPWYALTGKPRCTPPEPVR